MAEVRQLYYVCFIKVDSAHLGDPAMRRRVYFILIRRQTGQKDWQVSDMFSSRNLSISKHCMPHGGMLLQTSLSHTGSLKIIAWRCMRSSNVRLTFHRLILIYLIVEIQWDWLQRWTILNFYPSTSIHSLFHAYLGPSSCSQRIATTSARWMMRFRKRYGREKQIGARILISIWPKGHSIAFKFVV